MTEHLSPSLFSLSLSPTLTQRGQVLKVLIGCKAAVDSVNTVGGTYEPLFWFTISTPGGGLTTISDATRRPFHRAVAEGQVEAAALLLSRGGTAAIEPLSCLCEVTSWAGYE
jgi:hypothetical protein